MDMYVVIWMVLVVAFAIIEIATMAFVALYFAVGAAAASIVAALGAPLGWQLAAFSVAGIALLVLTRPVIKKRLESPDIPTNVDRMIGKSGIVTIPVDNDANTGQVRIGTEYWTARMPDDAPRELLEVDARVEVVAIEGVTARVVRRDGAPTA
jgi:membrane protein implicated in regulation of membrane protease activity